MVHETTPVQQEQVIKRVKDLTSRLVNGKEDRSTSVGHFFEHLTQLSGTEGILIQVHGAALLLAKTAWSETFSSEYTYLPTSRLIQEDKGWLAN
jgi:hypothetical protein